MSVIKLPHEIFVYIVLGVDAHNHDQVLAVWSTFDKAKSYCTVMPSKSEYYDLWIEKHLVA